MRQLGDGAHGGELHLLVDGRRADVERTAEDEREAQHVVDLVRIVRTAGAEDRVGTHRQRLFRQDFRRRVGHRQDDRRARHQRDHLGLEHAAGRQAEEHVRPADDVGQLACRRLLRVAGLVRVHLLLAADIDHAGAVGDEDVAHRQAEADDQVQAGQRRRARAGGDELDFGDVLADVLQRVQDRRRGDDGGAVLVVVEDRDLHALAQLGLDVEALRRLDVLEVDAAEGRLHARDGVDQRVGVVLGQFDVEHVDAGELLEQAGLAFHHRLAGQRADVAQAQHRGAVGDDGHQVGARGQVHRLGRVARDLHAGVGHAGRIGQRQVALGGHRLGRVDRDLARRRVAVVFECGFAQVVCHGGLRWSVRPHRRRGCRVQPRRRARAGPAPGSAAARRHAPSGRLLR